MSLNHAPVNPPRKGYIGEIVFFSFWQKTAETAPVGAWDDVDATVFSWMFGEYRWKAEQREASIAASILCWLGTNCGIGFLHEARRFAERLPDAARGTAYVMAWARENQRRGFVNGGIRTLEHCLTPYNSIIKGGPVELSGRDLEAAECVVAWLASSDGVKFLIKCEAAISRQQKQKQLAKMVASGQGDSRWALQLRQELGV